MINIVKYEEDYDRILKEFELSSANEIGLEFPLCYIKTCTKFNKRFSSKCETYEKSFIYLGLDKETQEVLATLIFVLKEFAIGGHKEKFVQVTTLKVHPEVRRNGIARELMKFVERKAVKMGVVYLVCKMNYGNRPAQELFVKRFGFREVSSVKMVSLGENGKEIKDPEVRLIDKEEALEKIKSFYQHKDYFPEDFKKILDSPAYMGTFVKTQGSEWVCASLWNTSYYSDLIISQVLTFNTLSPSLKTTFYFTLSVLLLSILFLTFFYSIYTYLTEKAYKITIFSLFLLLSVFLVQWLSTLIKYFRQSQALPSPRLRVFGICYNNTIEKKKPLLLNLLNHISCLNKCDYTSFEFHEDDVYASLFAEYSFRKFYLGKSLNNSIVFNWNKRHFIDPRE